MTTGINKKKLVACLLLALVIATAGEWGTMAFLSTGVVATNVVTTGGVDIALVETTETGDPFPADGVQVLPGDVVGKVVRVSNAGGHPAYVRVCVSKAVDDPALAAEDAISVVDFNETDWTFGPDGYWYYGRALPAGVATEPLFTKVQVNGEVVGNEFIGKSLLVTVSVQAVQSENNGSSVLDATGWPEANE